MAGSKPKSLHGTATPAAAPPPPKALPRGPHTLQLIFHLAVHSLLLLLCTIVLPSHLLTRSSDDEAVSHLSFLASTAYLFRLPYTEDNAQLLRKCMWGGVQGCILVQAWGLIRFRKWYDLGRAIGAGDRAEAEVVNKRGWAKGAEMLTLSSVSLPAAFAIVYALLVTLGSPAFSDVKANSLLSLAITLLVAFPCLHVLPSDMHTWTRLLGMLHARSAQEVLFILTTLLPLVTSFLTSAALTFDHGKAWSATYPVPPLIGLFVGAIAADGIAIPLYLLSRK